MKDWTLEKANLVLSIELKFNEIYKNEYGYEFDDSYSYAEYLIDHYIPSIREYDV